MSPRCPSSYTAACVALCEADGVLDVDASIRACLPELPALFEPVNIRHLLSHLAGLPRGQADELAARASGRTRRLVERPGAVGPDRRAWPREPRLLAEPGAGYAYSTRRLLAAGGGGGAGQRHAPGRLQRARAAVRAAGHGGTAGSGTIQTRRSRAWCSAMSPRTMGSSRSTPASARGGRRRAFDHDRGPGPVGRLLGPAARRWVRRFPERMLTRGDRNDGARLYYAWGVAERSHRGARTISHGGNFIGYFSKFARFPRAGLLRRLAPWPTPTT